MVKLFRHRTEWNWPKWWRIETMQYMLSWESIKGGLGWGDGLENYFLWSQLTGGIGRGRSDWTRRNRNSLDRRRVRPKWRQLNCVSHFKVMASITGLLHPLTLHRFNLVLYLGSDSSPNPTSLGMSFFPSGCRAVVILKASDWSMCRWEVIGTSSSSPTDSCTGFWSQGPEHMMQVGLSSQPANDEQAISEFRQLQDREGE